MCSQMNESRKAEPSRIYELTFFDDQQEEDVKPELSSLCSEAMAPGSDKQAWKKQQRMIRNRESAALSRKRKRDRIEFLEQQVKPILTSRITGLCLILYPEEPNNEIPGTSSFLRTRYRRLMSAGSFL